MFPGTCRPCYPHPPYHPYRPYLSGSIAEDCVLLTGPSLWCPGGLMLDPPGPTPCGVVCVLEVAPWRTAGSGDCWSRVEWMLGRLRLLMTDVPRGAGRDGVTEGEEGAEPGVELGLSVMSPCCFCCPRSWAG